MMMSLNRLLSRLGRETRGVAAVEFAIILPLMTILYLGVVETATALIADRKTTAMASTAADLAAQAMVLTNSDISDIFGAARAIMQPYDASSIQIRITSASDQGNGKVRVDWSDGHNMTPRSKGQTITVPDNIVFANGSVIIAEVAYTYKSTFTEYASGDIEMTDKFYARPRRTLVIGRTP
jgi:Flp pilus assembly protein TadG